MSYRPRRRPSTMKASLRTGGRDVTVELIDVSEAGLRIGVRCDVAPGESVTIATPRMQLPATVMWARKGEVGLRLDTKLTPGQQTELTGLSWGM